LDSQARLEHAPELDWRGQLARFHPCQLCQFVLEGCFPFVDVDPPLFVGVEAYVFCVLQRRLAEHRGERVVIEEVVVESVHSVCVPLDVINQITHVD
jgi:hypothetical protein